MLRLALIPLALCAVAACADKRPTHNPTPAPTHSPPNQDDCTPRPGENRTC